jgi:hypothetical protein
VIAGPRQNAITAPMFADGPMDGAMIVTYPLGGRIYASSSWFDNA